MSPFQSGGNYGNGGIYAPLSDTWSAVSNNGAPSPRLNHSAVWTGTEMIVWGGVSGGDVGSFQAHSNGGIYNPGSNQWRQMASAPASFNLDGHTAVWTGTEMIVWGGSGISSLGMAYNPRTNTWRTISSVAAPSLRTGHGAAWTGEAMVIWGGSHPDDFDSDGTAPGTGGLYYPATDSWVPIATSNAPAGGDGRYAILGERGVELLWTGSKIIALPINTFNEMTSLWLHEGGIYDPKTNQWQRIEATGSSNLRRYMAAWTGQHLVAVGSSGNRAAALGYDFNANRWSEVATAQTGSFQGRAGTWATNMNELLVFGGMWADGLDEFSGGEPGKRGFRLVFGVGGVAPTPTP